MDYELISAEDYENLPDEPDMKFVELDHICRRNMNQMISQDTPPDFDNLVRLQYMTTMAAAAVELGIPDILYPHGEAYPANKFPEFLLTVSGAVTRIRLRSGSRAAPYSVRLGVRTKARIELQVQKLRTLITEASLSESKRTALLKKLDELILELNQTRLSFAKTLKILAAIGVALGGTTTFLADAPEAIATITSLIGQDKEAEDAEAKRLGAIIEQKRLPAPLPQDSSASTDWETPEPSTGPTNDLDDDIPF